MPIKELKMSFRTPSMLAIRACYLWFLPSKVGAMWARWMMYSSMALDYVSLSLPSIR